MADIQILDHGTIWTFEPLSADAKNFFKTELETEGWQWMGPRLCVDHRPAMMLREHLIDNGFSLQ